MTDLDSVPWAELHHAYGPATDVPAQLRALSSADAEERRRAHHDLGGNVYHQGTRWQASCHVVPFLAQLVDDPTTPDRAHVVALLRAVALGDRDDTDLPFVPDQAFAASETVTAEDVAAMLEWLYEGGAEDGDEPEDVFEAVAVAWDRDAYLAAAAISGRFASWTSDPDPLIAAQAAELLAWFPLTEPALSALIEIPARAEVARASANLTLAFVAAADPAVNQRLTDLLTAESHGVRLTAAIALAFRGTQEAGLHLLRAPRGADFPLPWSRSMYGFAKLALRRSAAP